MKFTAYEAGAIQPLVANSPLMSWLYADLQRAGDLEPDRRRRDRRGRADRAAALVGGRLRASAA